MKTLGEFIIQNKYEYPGANSDIGGILASIRLVAKIIHREINRAGLSDDILGSRDLENVQGEVQMKLDFFANETMKKALLAREDIAGFASEENENFVEFDTDRAHKAKYILMTDPLDGSSNIDVNVSVGTIFSIYERISPVGGPLTLEDFLQEGRKQIAAGYIIYGSSTMLVYTTGHGVNGFTYDNALGIFILSHPNMKIPQNGKTYSINEGKFNMFNSKVQNFINYYREYDPSTNRPFDSRYSGAMVADFHRILLKGGIYMYPKSKFYPEGKLRLLYEGNPIAFFSEQAGGLAVDGNYMNILEIKPTRLHERIECFVGSNNIVKNFVDNF